MGSGSRERDEEIAIILASASDRLLHRIEQWRGTSTIYWRVFYMVNNVFEQGWIWHSVEEGFNPRIYKLAS